MKHCQGLLSADAYDVAGHIEPRSGEGKARFRAEVMKACFLEDNFLANDKRYPFTKIETNSARAFATNAKAGHIWDNFSSLTDKELSPVDELEFFHPFDETQQIKFKPKDKNVAPGYYRTPSLISVWSSAHRCCTTTRWENLQAFLPWRAEWKHLTMQ